MEARHKNLLIGTLLAVVLVMAVGYAAFAQSLTINGSAEITSTWDVHIESITPQTPTGTGKSLSATVGDDNLSATFSTELLSPGDSVTYNVTVKNGGTINAKLGSLTFSEDNTDDPIVYSYSGITQNDVLNANADTTFQVTVTYNNAVTTQPNPEDLTKALTMVLNYVQA